MRDVEKSHKSMASVAEQPTSKVQLEDRIRATISTETTYAAAELPTWQWRKSSQILSSTAEVWYSWAIVRQATCRGLP